MFQVILFGIVIVISYIVGLKMFLKLGEDIRREKQERDIKLSKMTEDEKSDFFKKEKKRAFMEEFIYFIMQVFN